LTNPLEMLLEEISINLKRFLQKNQRVSKTFIPILFIVMLISIQEVSHQIFQGQADLKNIMVATVFSKTYHKIRRKLARHSRTSLLINQINQPELHSRSPKSNINQNLLLERRLMRMTNLMLKIVSLLTIPKSRMILEIIKLSRKD
jgi:hypothetical protein